MIDYGINKQKVYHFGRKHTSTHPKGTGAVWVAPHYLKKWNPFLCLLFMVLCQTVHDLMPVFLYLTSCLRYQQKRKCIHLCFPTDSAPYGESHWALLPAGSPSSVPIQPSSAYGGLFSRSAVDGIHWKGCTWRGWHPYQLPNNIIWPSECTGTSLTLRPFGLSGYSLCHGYQAQLVCGQTSLWLLESIILFCWSLPKAFD